MGEYLELCRHLKAVKFRYDKDKHPDHIDDERIFFGVIAQDLTKIFSLDKYSIVSKDKNSGYLKVDYSQLVPLLIKAIQESIEIIELIPVLLNKIDSLLEMRGADPEKIEEKKIDDCTCQCNYSCTCQCDYSCTCQCNYSCTCNCYYACTCQCDYNENNK